MLRPPKLHSFMCLSFPTTGHGLIDTMTKSDVIMTSYCWIYGLNPNFPQSRRKAKNTEIVRSSDNIKTLIGERMTNLLKYLWYHDNVI